MHLAAHATVAHAVLASAAVASAALNNSFFIILISSVVSQRFSEENALNGRDLWG